ncbi:MAG: UDP-N-acetylmuramoyl-L-alanine--D-glutamate ligase [Flavobacteriales bacterium]
MHYPQKHISVLGAGESGVGAALLAKSKGCNVFVSDQKVIKPNYAEELKSAAIEFEENGHSAERILNSELIIKSPGISEKAEIISKAKELGIKVIAETEYAASFTKAKIIAITGTNGKTTTTHLTTHLLKKAGANVAMAGNVGTSFARLVIDDKYDYYVLELSSFQLDGMYHFKADAAVLLNITPDHLDRYDYKLENYIQSKLRITQNQTAEDAFIYCDDDPILREALKHFKPKAKTYPFSIEHKVEEGSFVANNQLHINIKQDPFTMSIFDLSLQGKHNQYNAMAAGIATRIFDIRKDSIRESLMDFENIEHRLEFVTKVHGIEFINDSKATNVNSAWYALESMENPVIWIAGGVDKGNDYGILSDIVRKKVKAIVCLGVDNRRIINAFDNIVNPIIETYNVIDAVKTAYRLGKKGDTVLLSPACASFDLFDNYEDRGRQFKKAVREL